MRERLDYDLPISAALKVGHHIGVSREELVCGWLDDLADTHDHQPDKEFVILSHRRKFHVFQACCRDAEQCVVPQVSLSYFLRVWRTNRGSKIVIRKCMRFALCDTCSAIQKKREATADRNTMKLLLCEEQIHLNLVRAERLAYGKRIAEATHGDSDVGSMAADGADQGAYGLPYYCQVKHNSFSSLYTTFVMYIIFVCMLSQASKTTSSMFKIRQFIVGVVIHGFGIHLFRHLDVFPRGSNVTIEVFHRVFDAILAVKKRLPRKFYIQVDV